MHIAPHASGQNFGFIVRPGMPPEENAISVRSHLAQALREAILSGALKPGDRLSDAELCQNFGGSRTSIREALRYLESEKLITILGNRRAYVSKITPKQAETIYQVLAGLLADAMTLLTKSIGLKNLNLMHFVHAELQAAHLRGSVRGTRQYLAQFYNLILCGCGDTVLMDLGENLLSRIGYLRTRVLADQNFRADMVAGVCKMIAALETKNQIAARNATFCCFEAEARAVADVFAG